MPRSVKEWIGKTDDTSAPPRVRLRVYERYKGICQLSKRPILAGEKWECHHVKELVAGKGLNRESNLVPVLVEPHKKESKRQMAVKKKVNRTRKKHLGIEAKKQKIPSRPKQSKRKAPRISKVPMKPRNLFERKE